MNWLVYAEEWLRGTLRDPWQHLRARTPRSCPVCDFQGWFINGFNRFESRCPNCSSKERDRMIALFMRKNGLTVKGRRILHFSPERSFFRQWRNYPGYVAGDVKKSQVANAVVDITAIQFPDNYFDLLICNHVLEHVPEDAKGIQECYRVMKPGGVAFFSVPIDNRRACSFEPPAEMSAAEVERMCGWDHKRLYGRDFPDKLRAVGLQVEPITPTTTEIAKYRLEHEPRHGAGYLDPVFFASKLA